MGLFGGMTVVERIRHGRDELVRMTRQDFGYDLMAWFNFLWDTDSYGYRGRRRSREKAMLPIKSTIRDSAWLQAVNELKSLETQDESGFAAGRDRGSEGET